MKRTSKKDQYFIEMLNAERKYRTAAGGEDADEPFITPVLFSLLDALTYVGIGLFAVFGSLLTIIIVG